MIYNNNLNPNQIKEISILIFGDPTQGEDGAMLAKKPWTPWSCASCDSKLNKYPGSLTDHKNWNKFPPKETSPERMTQGKVSLSLIQLI